MIKNQHENKLNVTKIMMLCWMCSETKRNRIINDNIIDIVVVAPIILMIVEVKLK